jgi:hypothetical protein
MLSRTILINTRVKVPLFRRLENYMRKQEPIPQRADAVRRLLERGLDAEDEQAESAA